MTELDDSQLSEKAEEVFNNVVAPAFRNLLNDYNGGGYGVKLVPDSPLITGIDKYASIMIRHPNGVEMVICVYWIAGSDKLAAENMRMVTLRKTFDLFTVTKDELEGQVKFLGGMRR